VTGCSHVAPEAMQCRPTTMMRTTASPSASTTSEVFRWRLPLFPPLSSFFLSWLSFLSWVFWGWPQGGGGHGNALGQPELGLL
jgi:hypothetical protein